MNEQCEYALRKAVATACAPASVSFRELRTLGEESARTAVLRVVYSEIVKCARDYNERHAGVLRLPPELLHSVLELLPVRERLRLAGVCIVWRDAAYTCPVPVSVPKSTKGVAVLTERLRHLTPAPLHITLDYTGSDTREVAVARYDLLRAHMWRTRELSVLCTEWDAQHDEGTQHALLAALRTPAPQLRRLCVESANIPALATLGKSWFDGHAPNLSCCRLSGSVPDAPALRLVRTVHIEDCRFELLRTVFENFPHLENLSLGSAEWPTSERRWRVPTTLQRLWIYNPENALDCFKHPQIPHIYLSYEPSKRDPALHLAEDIRRFQSELATHVDMHLSSPFGPHMLAIRTVSAHRPGHSRGFTLSWAGKLDLAHVSFGHVATMSLEGVFASDVLRMPDLPALHRLTIACAASPTDETRSSVPFMQLHCPALEDLVLRVAAPASRLRALWVALFISAGLGRSTGRRIGLTVLGAKLVAPGMDDLRAVVSRLEVDPSAPHPESWVESTAFSAAWGPDLAYD